MTPRLRLQDLFGLCALLTALLAGLASPVRALEVLGGPDPKPLLLAELDGEVAGVAAVLGRMVFQAKTGDSTTLQVVSATLIGPDLLLTTSHAFYQTSEPLKGKRAKMRTSCEILSETRDFRAVRCTGMQYLPAFARTNTDSGERAVKPCLHFAAYPGADGLAQEAVCRLETPAPAPLTPMNLQTVDPSSPALVPFMARRELAGTGTERWDAVVGEPCRLVIDRSLLRPGSFAGPSGNALRHYCAIWSGGSGAPVLQQAPNGDFQIVGIHLGERYNPKDIIRRIGDRQFIAPHRFKGRNANVAVSVEQVGELLDALDDLR